jgi:hypothetical protein
MRWISWSLSGRNGCQVTVQAIVFWSSIGTQACPEIVGLTP